MRRDAVTVEIQEELCLLRDPAQEVAQMLAFIGVSDQSTKQHFLIVLVLGESFGHWSYDFFDGAIRDLGE